MNRALLLAAESDEINPLVPHAAEIVVGLVVLMAVVGAVAVAADASKRGDSAALWVLVVVLTGPIGLIAYAVSRAAADRPRA